VSVELLPVDAFLGRECGTPRLIQWLESVELEFEDLSRDVQFMWPVMVVEPDDGVLSTCHSIVERLLDAVWVLVRLGNLKDAYSSDSPVIVGLNLIFQHHNVIAHR